MSLEYQCPRCSNRITQVSLGIGEKAVCKRCSFEHRVPKSAQEVNEVGAEPAPQVSKLQSHLGKAVWNPMGFKWVAFFFTMYPAFLLAALNWERMGYPKKKRNLLWIAALTFPIFIFFVFLPIDNGDTRIVTTLFGVLSWTLGVHLAFKQRPAYNEFRKAGGNKAGYGMPILFSGLFVVVIFAFATGSLYFYDEYQAKRFEEGMIALDNEQYELARATYRGLADYYADDPALWYNLGISYLNLDQLDSAGMALRKGLSLDPTDLDFKWTLTYMHDDLDWYPENGEALTWYESGLPKSVSHYSLGALHGSRTYYWPNGNPRRLVTFRNGIPDGPLGVWFENGAKCVEGMAQNGFLHGPILRWNEASANPDTVAVYSAGVLTIGEDMQYLLESGFEMDSGG